MRNDISLCLPFIMFFIKFNGLHLVLIFSYSLKIELYTDKFIAIYSIIKMK